MKGRETKGAPSADLLVCFPSRAHLALMPKPICSPARPSDPNKRHHHLKKIATRAGAGGGRASPILWAKNKQMGRGGGGGGVEAQEIAEPTSPKVTCAGQIKVRPRSTAASCRNWQSVMEEIERIHNRSKTKKKSNWAGSLGFKKDIMNFLTCLRSIRFDFRCFGSFPEADASDEEGEGDEDEDDYDEEYRESGEGIDQGNAVFSKWFTVLQENNVGIGKENKQRKLEDGELEGDKSAPEVPPANALLLMRCRSAPAKSWLKEKEKEKENRENEKEQRKEETEEMEENEKMDEPENTNKKKKRESLAIVMKYDKDFYELSTEVAQETWLVGGFTDPFSRSRSWKR